MKQAVLLGAGFSSAISPEMPATAGLAAQVASRLGLPVNSAAGSGPQFEAWLSSLADPQPYLDEAANHENQAQFLRAAAAIHAILIECQARAMSGEPPYWLCRFVAALHYSRATVITFNYDLLLERLVKQMGLLASAADLLQGLPPTVASHASTNFHGIESFSYLKLHGSLDTFWVPDDRSGATIARFDDGAAWDPHVPSDDQRRRLLPGREPFLIPPTATKSHFYSNPISRELWLRAFTALNNADDVVLVGYSVPMTDLVTTAMLRRALAETSSRVTVVSRSPEPIADRLVQLGIESERIATIAGDDACATFASEIEWGLLTAIADQRLGGGIGPAGEQDYGLRAGTEEQQFYVREISDESTSTHAVLLLHPGPAKPPISEPQPPTPIVRESDLLSRCPDLCRITVEFPTGRRAGIYDSRIEGPYDGPLWILLKTTLPPNLSAT